MIVKVYRELTLVGKQMATKEIGRIRESKQVIRNGGNLRQDFQNFQDYRIWLKTSNSKKSVQSVELSGFSGLKSSLL